MPHIAGVAVRDRSGPINYLSLTRYALRNVQSFQCFISHFHFFVRDILFSLRFHSVNGKENYLATIESSRAKIFQ